MGTIFSDTYGFFFQQRCRHTSGRTLFDPAGNESFTFVKEGNIMAARCACLVMLASCLKSIWMVEQPRGTILWAQSRINDLFKTISATWFHFRLIYAMLRFKVFGCSFKLEASHMFSFSVPLGTRYTGLAFGWVHLVAKIRNAMKLFATMPSLQKVWKAVLDTFPVKTR